MRDVYYDLKGEMVAVMGMTTMIAMAVMITRVSMSRAMNRLYLEEKCKTKHKSGGDVGVGGMRWRKWRK